VSSCGLSMLLGRQYCTSDKRPRRICSPYCRLSMADKLKLFSGKKSTGKSLDSSVKSRRHLPRFQTQVITLRCGLLSINTVTYSLVVIRFTDDDDDERRINFSGR